jgi:hypothetical protein
MPPDYAELHCVSNFSFLRGASHPEELVARAAELGYRALAITDECSLAGVVRAHQAAKEHGLHLIIGTEVRLSTAGWGERREPQQAHAGSACACWGSRRSPQPAGSAGRAAPMMRCAWCCWQRISRATRTSRN